ncbi:P1 family peptidase [Caldinitratiruptor microaerophilus]|uniref:Peptidase S58 n=1 Tax=Caldinitratiruptor microaerophilus TaxID=671077 RepID=A0AA35CQQ1_9FIRM|nr:P1 family peptidase [Caldinitratiruptor microaerophilus]BDG62412.1 peptidase S58 [Caldinitratiruptor microaerophilus]
MAGAITDVPGIRVGHATDVVGLTGCTVVLCPEGGVVAADVRGGAPGTRETDLARPGQLVERAHAVLLTGGSAYGLDAASGVMRYLEEQGKGFPTPAGVVPIVPAAVLYDLALGDPRARPDAAMGYEACRAATGGSVAEGNVGAGTGASVGKLLGPAFAMKSGLGTASVRLPGSGVVGAVVAVNAAGDVRDPRTGRIVAGARAPDGAFLDAARRLLAGEPPAALPGQNTTIGCVATDVRLTKEQAAVVARMAHAGLARTIEPAFTPYDGDTVFVLSCGDKDGDVTLVGLAAARAVEEAILRAVRLAASAGGLPGLAG